MTDFGITPAQIAQIAADWRECGSTVADAAIDVPPAGGSLLATAAAAFCRRADQVTGADGRRLVALGDALAAFNAVTQASDEAAAGELGAVTESIR